MLACAIPKRRPRQSAHPATRLSSYPDDYTPDRNHDDRNPNELTPAQQRLVTDNMGILYLVAMRLYNNSTFIRQRLGSVDEAISAGSVGIVKAAQLFDPSRGFKFTTYAASCIEKNIIRAAEESLIVHVPIYVRQRTKKDPDFKFAKHAAVASGCQSMTATETFDLESFDELPLDYAKLHEALEELPERERGVIKMRFWDRLTLSAVGDELGISKERVRQIQNDTIAMLRGRLRPD